MATEKRHDKRYKEAVALRERLRTELEQVEQFLALYDRIFGDEPQQATKAAAAPVAPAEAPEKAKRTVISEQDDFERVARTLLVARGRPATRGQFAKLLEQHGYEVPGVNRMKNIGTKLWRAKEAIVHIEDHGYWLRDMPCSAVGYEPRVESSGPLSEGGGTNPDVKAKPNGGGRHLLA